MKDEMESRAWVKHGPEFTALMWKIIDTVGISLKRLNKIQFDAPWRDSATKKCQSCS